MKRKVSKKYKIGTKVSTNQSGDCTVIDYRDKNNILVEFEDGTNKVVNYSNLNKGNVFNGEAGREWQSWQTLNNAQIISLFKEVHGDAYSYDLVKYVAGYLKVEIVCPTHNSFLQTPNQHRAGSGCPNCATFGKEPSRVGVVYIFVDQDTVKVGVTSQPILRRLKQLNSSSGSSFDVAYTKTFSRIRCFEVEQAMHNILIEEGFERDNEIRQGYTECFKDVPLSVVIGILEQHD